MYWIYSCILISTFLLQPHPVLSEDQPANGQHLLKSAHSHNDYLRRNPLHDALNAGFWSVEADIFLRKGRLVVAHTRLGALRNRCFEEMYLMPLAAIVKQNNGNVYKNGPKGFELMIDIKSDAKETYDSLHKLLKSYEWMLTVHKDDSVRKGAVSVLISGNRNYTQILSHNPQLASLDGRRNDLGGTYTADEMPRISMSLRSVTNWRGRGEIPEQDLQQIKALVEKANAGGHQLRFWAATNRRRVWHALLDAGVHIINVDRVNRYQQFKEKYRKGLH